jgi:hypothetical protein
MKKEFTSGQKEILARKLGYDGPMQGFDQYIKSSPALSAKYSTITDKYVQRMAKGGLTRKKFAVGGDAKGGGNPVPDWMNAPAEGSSNSMALVNFTNPTTGEKYTAPSGGYSLKSASTPGSTPSNGMGSLGGMVGGNGGLADFIQNDPNRNRYTDTFRPAQQIGSYEQYLAGRGALQMDVPLTRQQFEARMQGNTPDVMTGRSLVGPGVTQPSATSTEDAPDYQTTATGVPRPQGTPILTAAQLQEQQNQFMAAQAAPTAASQGTASQVSNVATAAAPTNIASANMTAAAATPALTAALQGVGPATGTVGAQSQVNAATQTPTTTAVGDVQAAQIDQAQTVQNAPTRTVQAGELISGSAVDQTRAEQAVQQTATGAAQGTVTEDMTVQGQLAKLTTNFDSTNPPSWAAGALRAATAQMSARGLSASSMAGQALIQATIEAALPIAAADAQAFQATAAQNLSNRQQKAVLAAQQRAAFLGQEFDQTFQTRVTNAARVADVANMNFTAQQQIALENAQMAQTVDLANLSNRQATTMATAAQLATLESTNLSNTQQAAVINAQTFLAMDMQNLGNEQQTSLFKAQQMTQAMLSDTAAVNAASQFNATSDNQTNQFMAGLSSQTSQFNAAQKNALGQFNADQSNAVSKFNVEQQNARDQFNANQRLVIDQSNAQWRRDISTANTAATNASNYLNAQQMQQMTLADYNNQIQLYRDQVEMAWSSWEKDEDRAMQVLVQQITSTGSLQAAEAKADSDSTSGVWSAVASVGAKWALSKIKF